MITPVTASTMQILETRAEAATERHDQTMRNLDFSSQADWDKLVNDGTDLALSTWARNEFHRLQHQTAKSILAST